MVLTVVFYPMHLRIRYRTDRPTLAAAISTLLVVLLIVLPVTFITIAVVKEMTGAAARLQDGVQRLTDPNVPLVGWLLEKARDYVDIDRESALQFLANRMQTWAALLASSTLVVVGGAVGAIAQMGLVVFAMFYLFRDGDRLRDAVYEMLPLQRMQTHSITIRTADVIAATVYGVLVISAIQGTLGTFIFWALGMPSPLLWGVVMFFLSMIPMAGSFLVWVPAAIFLALSGSLDGASSSSAPSTTSCRHAW
jgi:predicted PurR-regulated permease PerM